MATTNNSTALDFNAIKTNLKTHFKSKSEFASYDFEATGLSNILDVLAYNTHYNGLIANFAINETFLDTAFQYNNIIRHGRILGYKNQGRPSTYGQVALYILVPASSVALGPDDDYIPILRRGSRFTSQSGLNFVLTDNVDFSAPQNETVVLEQMLPPAPQHSMLSKHSAMLYPVIFHSNK